MQVISLPPSLPPPSQEALDVKTSELASQRIAFEEEKLAQQTEGEVKVQDSEAEQLRHKLKEQVRE